MTLCMIINMVRFSLMICFSLSIFSVWFCFSFPFFLFFHFFYIQWLTSVIFFSTLGCTHLKHPFIQQIIQWLAHHIPGSVPCGGEYRVIMTDIAHLESFPSNIYTCFPCLYFKILEISSNSYLLSPFCVKHSREFLFS